MGIIPGSKKFKGKLTSRKRGKDVEADENSKEGTSSVASLKSRSASSATAVIEPLDLRSNFFAQDEYQPSTAGSHKGSHSGPSRKPSVVPTEQSNAIKYSDARIHRATSRKQSVGMEDQDISSFRRSESTYRGSIPRDEEIAPTTRLIGASPQQLYSHMENFRFDGGFSSRAIENSRRGSYGKMPIINSRIDEGEALMAEQGPFDHDHEIPGSPRTEASSSSFPRKYSTWSSAPTADVDLPLRDEKDHEKASHYSAAYRHSILSDQLAEMTYSEKRMKSQRSESLPAYDENDYEAALPIHRKTLRQAKKWYRGWSTRSIILMVVGFISTCALAIGLSLGLYFKSKDATESSGLTPTWRPAQGTTWNIQLSSSMLPIGSARIYSYAVYDIDLFTTNATTITMLHSAGRQVICHFSAGTYEPNQADASKFPNNTLGSTYDGNDVYSNPGFNGSKAVGVRWIDTRDSTIRSIMTARIDTAVAKGCDGVDPGNMDGYKSSTGFPLDTSTGVDYMNHLATYAHTRDAAIGLRNSYELINGTIDSLDWHVNENCAMTGSCKFSQPFVQAGKPVLHIEYSTSGGQNATLLRQACTASGTHGFSTLIKRNGLDGWAMRCPYGDTTYGSVDSSM